MSFTVSCSTRSGDPLPVCINTRSKDLTVRSEPDTKAAIMKLSPDCVAAILDPTTSDCEIHLRMPSNVVSNTGCSRVVTLDSLPRGNADDYNLPPIRTPLHTQRKPVTTTPLLRLDSPSVTKLPKDATAMIGATNPDVAGSELSPCILPRFPQIPKPIPISGKARRHQSDNLAQVQSSQRRSIFGHYFNQHQHQTLRTQSHSSYTVPSRKNQQQGRRRRHEQQADIQQDMQCKLSSSGSILETVAIKPISVDYRMFAPPKEHAHKSAICGRFHSVEDLSVTLELERRALPPLPSPLRRFCSSSEVNLSLRSKSCSDSSIEHSNTSLTASGGMHGMYPLMTPVPILRKSSYRRSPSENRNNSISDNCGWYGSHSNLNNSLNLTESSRNLNIRCGKGSLGRNHFVRKTSSSTVSSSATANSDDLTSSHSLDDKNNKMAVRFDPRVTVTEFEDAVERVWYDDCELERLKKETILLTQQYLMTHPMEAEKYFRATMDPVTNTYRKRPLFSLPVLSSEDVGSGDTDHSHLSESLSTMNSESLQELCKDQVKRILIVDPNPSILALFCKSMSSMFPTAELVTAQSAERALNFIKASLGSEKADDTNFLDSISPSSSKFERKSHAFDIIIIEQSLYPHSPRVGSRKTEPASGSPLLDYDSLNKRQGSRMMLPRNSSMPDIEKREASTFRAVTKSGSFLHHDIAMGTRSSCREPRCGSDLTRAIVKLGQHDSPDDSPSISTSNATVIASNFEWKALLIGVSMHPDHHAQLMQEAGSDIVWGKPIPRIGDALRNQLLKALLDKRHGSSVSD